MLKKITQAQLRAYQDRLHSKVANATDQTIRDLKRLYVSFNAQFSKVISDTALTEREAKKFNEMTRVMRELTTILDNAGLEDVVNGYRKHFVEITERVAEYSELWGVKENLRGIDAGMLDSLIDYSETELRKFVDRTLISPVRSGLIAGIVGNRDPKTIADEIFALTSNLTPRQAQTLVDDSFSRYHRFARAEQARALDLQVYQYIGPNDQLTRPACDAMLHFNEHGAPGFFYEDEITTDLHPDLEENPLVAGGGWNCRHDFFPVTLAYAESRGFIPDPSRSTDEA